MKILIDARLKRFIEEMNEYDNDVCSVSFTDIEDKFYFNSKIELQAFLCAQAVERFYDKKIRKGFFDYEDSYNEVRRYYITAVNRGRLEIEEKVIA